MKAADGETIDRVREAEGAEEKIKVEIDATNQWLKINAEEVFHKIHELERHLNHHKKHTSIPNWAQSINPRLDGIDAKLSKLATTSGAKETQNSSHHLSDEQYKKVSENLSQRLEETKSVFDTETIDLQANLERLQEHLNLRPTSTELSKVYILLNDIKNQIHTCMVKEQMNSYQMVEDKVAENVGNVSKKLDLSEHKREQGIESTLKKTERFHQMIADIKDEVELKVSSVQGEHGEIVKKYETYAPRHDQIEKRLKNNVSECKENFEGIRKSQALAMQDFTEYKGYTNIELEKLKKLSEEVDQKLRAVNTKLREKDAAQTERFNAINERVEEFLRLYEFDFTKVKEDVNKLKITALERQHSTLTDHNDYISLMKERDIMNVVVKHEEQIASIFESMEDFERRLATQNDIIKTVEGMVAMVSEEMENFPEMVTKQTLRLIKLNQLLDKSTKAMSEMKTSFETVVSHVSELYNMSSDVAEIKENGASSSEKVNAVQANLDSIKEKANNHDKVIQEIREQFGEIENNFDGVLMEVKDDAENEIIGYCGEFVESTDKVLLGIEVQNSKLAEHSVEMLSSNIGKSQSLDPNSILDGGDSEILMRPSPVTGQHAEMVAQMCLSYEGLGARTNTVPNIPDTICEQLLVIAEQLTKYTSSQTDLDAVESLVSEANLKVSAESLAEKSKAKVDGFVDQCRTLVDIKNPPNKVTQLRNDCRDKYFNLFLGSLYSLLSTHDQVIIVGNSRFGRTKIPTRETPKKPSREILYSSQAQRQTKSRKGSRVEFNDTVHTVPDVVQEETYPQPDNNEITREGDSIQTWSMLNLPPVSIKPDNIPLSMSRSEENFAYVLKSGFKMPLKSNAGGSIGRIGDELQRGSRSRDGSPTGDSKISLASKGKLLQ